MSSGNIGYTEGWASPASIKAELGHKYRWLKTGAVYKQVGTGVSNNWVEDGAASPEYLNDLLDVNTTPLIGQSLTWNGSEWINIDVTNLGNTLFVSTNGKTIAIGAERESISNSFSSLSEARTTALSGDTIVVHPGTYANPGNLWKDGVNYVFMPGVEINFTGTIYGASANQSCNIYGKANFTQTGSSGSPAFSCEQTGSSGTFEANNITVYGNVGFQLTHGEFDFIANEITMTYRQYLLYFRLTTGRFYIKANKINNENGSGLTIARTIYLRALSATSDVRIDAPYIGLDGVGANSQLVYYINEPSDGVAIINGNFHDTRTITDSLGSVWLGTNATINGDITMLGDIPALKIGSNQTKVIKFTGNIYHLSASVLPAIDVSGNSGTLIFKGDVYTTSDLSAYFTGTSVTYFNGNIYNQHVAGAIVTGIEVDATHDFIVEFAKVYFELAPHVAGSYCITGSNNNVRIYTNLLSNVAADPATNNLITGTNIIIDTDIL